MKVLVGCMLLVIAAPLWVIGELGTLGGIQPADHQWNEYVNFHALFVVPWAASIALTLYAMKLLHD